MVGNQFGKKDAIQTYIKWLKKINKSGEIFKIAEKRYGEKAKDKRRKSN